MPDATQAQWRSILITGASSGIGLALAEALASPGVLMSVNGRDQERLQSAAEKLRQKGAEVETSLCPVTDEAGMAKWIKDINSRRPLDLVIANAGISGGTGGDNADGGGESAAQANAIMSTNVQGVMNTLLPALPIMRERGRGQMVIISSLAGYRGFAGAPAYSASKVAVRAWGEALRGWLKADGVKVNVVMPGFVKSRITDANDFPMPFFMSAEKAAKIIISGLLKNKGRIAFPWPMAFSAWLLGAMPNVLSEFIVRLLPEKK